VPIPAVLDVGGFDLERAVATKPTFLEPEHPFEWAGTFEVQEGVYELTLDEGPDPTMALVGLYLDQGAQAHDRSAAERALRVWSEPPQKVTATSASVELGASQAASLQLQASGTKRFSLRAPRAGRVGIYTQPLFSDFALRVSRGDAQVEPLTEHEFAAGHSHDDEVTSVGLHLDGAVDGERLNKWLYELLREKGTDIFRMKGIINIKGNENRFVFRGVHMLFDGREERPWGDAPRASDLVFIGKKLDRDALTRGFERCRA
jgi:G3E family GTPase